MKLNFKNNIIIFLLVIVITTTLYFVLYKKNTIESFDNLNNDYFKKYTKNDHDNNFNYYIFDNNNNIFNEKIHVDISGELIDVDPPFTQDNVDIILNKNQDISGFKIGNNFKINIYKNIDFSKNDFSKLFHDYKSLQILLKTKNQSGKNLIYPNTNSDTFNKNVELTLDGIDMSFINIHQVSQPTQESNQFLTREELLEMIKNNEISNNSIGLDIGFDSMYEYLLDKANPNTLYNYYNPYSDIAYEHAMNSNNNPIVNYPHGSNPILFSQKYFNNGYSPMMQASLFNEHIISNNKPNEISNNKPNEISNNVSNNKPNEISNYVSNNASNNVSNNPSNNISNNASNNIVSNTRNNLSNNRSNKELSNHLLILPETNDSIKNKYQNTQQKDIDNNPDKSNINPDNNNNILPNKPHGSIQGVTSNVNNNLTPVQNNLTSVNSNLTEDQKHTCMKNNSENSPPCPACSRCPQSMFESKKVPKYGESLGTAHLPRPILTDFSTFGM
jgi:hypothetical protein